MKFTSLQVTCVVLHLIIHYLMLTNYFWMFCEGLHLWLVLVVVRVILGPRVVRTKCEC